MKPRDVFGLLALVGLGVTLYRLANPKCPWCRSALELVSLGQKVVCPSCHSPVTTLQSLLA